MGANAPQAAFCQFCGQSLRDAPRAGVVMPPAAPLQAAAASAPSPAGGLTAAVPQLGGAGPQPVVPQPLVAQVVEAGPAAPPTAPHFVPQQVAVPQQVGQSPAPSAPAHLVPSQPSWEAPSAAEPAMGPPPEAPVSPPEQTQASRGFLVVIGQDGSPGRRFPLSKDQIDLGRTEGDIRIGSDRFVSPRHARLVFREGRYHVRDLESRNGLYLRTREPSRLEHGDLILLGLQVLRFEVVRSTGDSLGAAVDGDTRVFGSPTAPRWGRLTQVTMEGVPRNLYYLSTEETVLGREQGDIVFTQDPFMSRSHAVITRDANTGVFWLRDLGSSNGTYLAVRGEAPLANGDHLRVGQHLFRFEAATGGHSST